MITIYMVSSARAAGKTAVSAGLANRLRGEGKKVGFLRTRVGGDGDGEGDAAFMKKVLGLSEPVDSLCPLIGDAPANDIKEAFATISTGKDVVIVEGQLGQASYQIASALSARVIGIENYGKTTSDSYRGFGGNLLGVMVNKVPKSRLTRAGEIRAQYAAMGVNVLGIIPEDRLLFASTVGELADGIQGKILSSADKSAELVENLMVGALVVDSGLLYFGRKANKAAIVRVDRPDMQLAALETPTKCLVIAGTGTIYYQVADKAVARGTPVVQAEGNTSSILAKIEAALVKARFAQEIKLPRLAEILEQSIDFKILYRGLGLAN